MENCLGLNVLNVDLDSFLQDWIAINVMLQLSGLSLVGRERLLQELSVDSVFPTLQTNCPSQ